MKNYNKEVKRCNKCIMPEVQDRIKIDRNGICNVCNSRINIQENVSEHKNNIEQLKNKILFYDKGEGKHNCAVSVSGGKDSIMTMYIAKKILGLKTLAIFIDNGFVLPEMYENAYNASEILGIDLIILKTPRFKKIFEKCLRSKKKIYYCRLCHIIIEYYVKKICNQNKINVLMGGYTKGQQYIKNSELFWIYDKSDKNIIDILKNDDELEELSELFKNPMHYLLKQFGNIVQLSPFKHTKWNENEIIELLTKELNFKLPKNSWPDKSSNCIFNYVAQLKALQDFGYSQHETELSDLVRKGELSRERALEIIRTPIDDFNLNKALSKMNLCIGDIILTNEKDIK